MSIFSDGARRAHDVLRANAGELINYTPPGGVATANFPATWSEQDKEVQSDDLGTTDYEEATAIIRSDDVALPVLRGIVTKFTTGKQYFVRRVQRIAGGEEYEVDLTTADSSERSMPNLRQGVR